MPMTCTVCAHPEIRAINQALISGESSRSIVARYGTLGRMAVQRHKAEHLPQAMAKAKEAEEVAHGSELLQNVKKLQNKAISLLLRAEREGDLRTALAGVREARGCMELLAKLVGELDESPTVNITLSGEWVQVRAIIVSALEDYPEARLSVARALQEAER